MNNHTVTCKVSMYSNGDKEMIISGAGNGVYQLKCEKHGEQWSVTLYRFRRVLIYTTKLKDEPQYFNIVFKGKSLTLLASFDKRLPHQYIEIATVQA